MRHLVLSAVLAYAPLSLLADPLPSWTNSHAKDQIVAFVDGVTSQNSPNYVTPSDRIAVFDNDGTLWAEQPVYFQFIFAMDRLAEMAEQDPSILTTPVLEAAAKGDLATVLEGGHDALIEVVNTTHSGDSVAEFQAAVADWLATERHPYTDLPYDQMTYQPMVELLRYLRDEGFTTYIVSGGGLHFMRVFAEEAYGIPPNQILGTYGNTSYEVIDGTPTIVKAPGIAFIDDKEGKPINIERTIGKRPILAGGNSDGDFAMMQWVTAGDGPRLGVLIHHTDADREWAYDRESAIGKLADGLDKGPDMGWVIVDMAQDWTRVYTGAN
ncbi:MULTISPECIES: HAD family phosphatase [unclassified Ruegeria]|uniref:HAD family hydrolase n=1 Tax=unclassified Ruegeria TaxID=2625375 RepID=UPI001487AC8C|nr:MULTISPECIES: HAD family hydrolase [unclassified Ruegeria]NOD75338.1 haloacid dehalogenase-like hydrolase [Ruegeria sp. HKCCD4332]NOD87299.1 haloacid dehalogenase-like hydrolase [Ruegeria sp. HKCCD4318]NOE12854.1 haloacid dehalogenase-like hydrolase [Ruegeria sp. HKCCD4318-2]NOG08979.1 haloacid dehalogenase-like hydrolase [Ruegeria sp. HKCCD4315]